MPLNSNLQCPTNFSLFNVSWSTAQTRHDDKLKFIGHKEGDETLPQIGVYGGTFDPIHNGHIEVAKDALTLFALDRLLLIPANVPPHKNAATISGANHRYTMTVLATIDDPKLEASLIEIERPDMPYSVQTVARLKERLRLAATDLFFLIGADSFAELHTWREPMKLIESCHLAVMTRPGYDVDLAPIPAPWRDRIVDLRGIRNVETRQYSETRIFLTDLTWVNVSATEIRKSVADGESIDEWVPPQVDKYIEKYGLYRAVND